MTILAFVDYYLPGYKAGGPLRAVSNLIEAIGDKVKFKVVTRDRDRDDHQPFSDIRIGEWQQVGKADVLYLPVESIDTSRIKLLLEESDHDLVFLNSMFSPVTRRVLMLKRRSQKLWPPIVIAPRGECAASALSQKRVRKNLYLGVARMLGLYDGLAWLSSSGHESDDIRGMWQRLGVKGRLQECPELPMHIESGLPSENTKQAGRLDVAFLGRIVPVKNLLGSIELLTAVKGEINFTIYGPKEDAAYWNLCEAKIRALPANVTVTYAGPIPHERVPEVLSRQHLLMAPSHGENYGHSIAEALSVGCPVLTSDQTPWRGLEAAGAGWDLDLSDIPGIGRARSAINSMVAMNASDYMAMRRRTQEYARDRTDYEAITRKNLEFFSALSTPSR